MNISENLNSIKSDIPNGVKLVAVSKTYGVNVLMQAYTAGQRIFGENKTQEMKEKHLLMPTDVEWHFIGHLQSNKIKYIIDYVSLIHSVDSGKLLQEINVHAQKCNRVVNCLLQFHIASEETKFGLNLNEAELILSSPSFSTLKNINVVGVMGMATFTENQSLIQKEFKELKSIFEILKNTYFREKQDFSEISMGMSSDFLLAIKEGSTLIRVGSAIFGSR